MPDKHTHERMVQRNKSAREALMETENHHEWVVTMAFYEAVHLVESLFALDNKHSHKHMQRNEDLENDFPHIYIHFFKLYNESVLARYLKLRSKIIYLTFFIKLAL